MQDTKTEVTALISSLMMYPFGYGFMMAKTHPWQAFFAIMTGVCFVLFVVLMWVASPLRTWNRS